MVQMKKRRIAIALAVGALLLLGTAAVAEKPNPPNMGPGGGAVQEQKSTPFRGVPLMPRGDPVMYENDWLSVQVDSEEPELANGRFTMGSIDQERTPPQFSILHDWYYPDPSPPIGCSFTTIRIQTNGDWADCIFGNRNDGHGEWVPGPGGESVWLEDRNGDGTPECYAEWLIKDYQIKVLQVIEFAESTTLAQDPEGNWYIERSGKDDVAKISYWVKNVGGDPREVGIRVLTDVWLDGIDGLDNVYCDAYEAAYYPIGPYDPIEFETSYYGEETPQFAHFYNIENSDTEAWYTFRGKEATMPDEVCFAYWPFAAQTRWDYPGYNMPLMKDVSVIQWWYPQVVEPDPEAWNLKQSFYIGLNQVWGMMIFHRQGPSPFPGIPEDPQDPMPMPDPLNPPRIDYVGSWEQDGIIGKIFNESAMPVYELKLGLALFETDIQGSDCRGKMMFEDGEDEYEKGPVDIMPGQVLAIEASDYVPVHGYVTGEKCGTKAPWSFSVSWQPSRGPDYAVQNMFCTGSSGWWGAQWKYKGSYADCPNGNIYGIIDDGWCERVRVCGPPTAEFDWSPKPQYEGTDESGNEKLVSFQDLSTDCECTPAEGDPGWDPNEDPRGLPHFGYFVDVNNDGQIEEGVDCFVYWGIVEWDWTVEDDCNPYDVSFEYECGWCGVPDGYADIEHMFPQDSCGDPNKWPVKLEVVDGSCVCGGPPQDPPPGDGAMADVTNYVEIVNCPPKVTDFSMTDKNGDPIEPGDEVKWGDPITVCVDIFDQNPLTGDEPCGEWFKYHIEWNNDSYESDWTPERSYCFDPITFPCDPGNMPYEAHFTMWVEDRKDSSEEEIGSVTIIKRHLDIEDPQPQKAEAIHWPIVVRLLDKQEPGEFNPGEGIEVRVQLKLFQDDGELETTGWFYGVTGPDGSAEVEVTVPEFTKWYWALYKEGLFKEDPYDGHKYYVMYNVEALESDCWGPAGPECSYLELGNGYRQEVALLHKATVESYPEFGEVMAADPLKKLRAYWSAADTAIEGQDWDNAQLYMSAFVGRMDYLLLKQRITQHQYDTVVLDQQPGKPGALTVLDVVEAAIFYRDP
jgi:hypothetical protein